MQRVRGRPLVGEARAVSAMSPVPRPRLQPGRKTSHRQFVRDGVKITLPGHGPADLTKKHVAMIVRQLEAAGFDRDTVRRELDA